MSHFPQLVAISAVAVFIASLATVGAYRKLAIRRQWFDLPNERSSHSVATPGGAGVALALVILCWCAMAALLGAVEPALLRSLLLACALAAMGWYDDRAPLSRRLRAAAFVLAALVMVVPASAQIGWLGVAAWVAFTFAFINSFNFMDGIDGLAVSEALIFAAVLLVLMLAGKGAINATPVALLSAALLAACSAAFLFWNAPPARVFLGDAGSLFLGFWIAALALQCHLSGAVHISTSVTLLAYFIADSGVTILQRLLNAERIVEPHKTHVYQLLTQRYKSHKAVSLRVALLNLLVLSPLAWLGHTKPELRTIICVGSCAVLCAIIWFLRKRLLYNGAAAQGRPLTDNNKDSSSPHNE